MISAIITVHNGEKYIRALIESFLKQRVSKEMIIVDSGQDRTEAIVKEYKSIRYYRHPEKSIYKKLNFGLKKAKGDILCWPGCDDRFTDKAFEIVEAKNADWLYGDAILIDENENEICKAVNVPYELEKLKKKNIIPNPSVFLKASVLKKYNLEFSEKYELNGDYDFALKLAHLMTPVQVHEFLIKIMVRPDTSTSILSGTNQVIKDRLEIQQKYA